MTYTIRVYFEQSYLDFNKYHQLALLHFHCNFDKLRDLLNLKIVSFVPKGKVFNTKLLLISLEKSLAKMSADNLIRLGNICLVPCCFFGSRTFKYD